MLRMLAAIILSSAVPATAAGQATPAATGAGQQMVRAAGMPLSDGALSPGSMTVRVVKGAFDGDLSGISVEVEVAGQKTLRAQTAAQGRAEFAHLPIGGNVRASAIVNGERLQSEVFAMPAESGVRLLLVTGAGVPVASSDAPMPLTAVAPPEVAATAVASPEGAAATVDPARAAIDGVTAVRVTVVSLTLIAFVLVGMQQWRRQHRGASSLARQAPDR